MKPRTQFRRTGPIARLNLFRFAIFAVILITAVLAVTMQAGIFKSMLKGSLTLGIVLLFGSYIVGWWLKHRRRQG